jgi:hypothetical protein
VLKLAGLAAITVLGAALYASTPAQAAYEIYFRTPSRNIECNVFEPRRADIGLVQCVVLSTKNRDGEPREWMLDSWRHVEVFRTLTCLSRHSRHGFTLSRQRQVTF